MRAEAAEQGLGSTPDTYAVNRPTTPKPTPAPVVRKEKKRTRTTKPKPNPAAQESAAEKLKVLLASFGGKIKKVRSTLFYKVALIFVCAMVVLLPILYLATIGLVGYGVYYHAANNTGILSMGYGRARIFAAMLYVAPLISGAVLFFFMLKPLFARPAKQTSQRNLSRTHQALLFAFVDRICDAVHAPKPKRIAIDFDLNASASFEQGLFGVFRRNLVLTIGLPLVGGLTLDQFAGVLAHEFGHFSQGLGMRASWLIRSINAWFARVVYSRDEWDEYLAEAASETDFRIGWLFLVAMLCVWLVRKLLLLLMLISHALSCGLLRQMEYDADRHETRLVGAKVFESTEHRMLHLSGGYQKLMVELMQGIYHGDLTNIPAEIRERTDELSADEKKKLSKQAEKSGWFDTHPVGSKRIAAAKKGGDASVFSCDKPAEWVFFKFEDLCKSLAHS